MSRANYKIHSFRVEIGADGDSVRNEFFNLHLNIEARPKRPNTSTRFYNDWSKRDQLWIKFRDPDHGEHDATVWVPWEMRFVNGEVGRQRVRSTDRLEALMAPDKFEGVLATLNNAQGA